MSHVVSISLTISDLATLRAAAEQCGMELSEQTSYRWYGSFYGNDSELPEGFTKEELGRCQYALRVKGSSDYYEVGVAWKNDKWNLLLDFFDESGNGGLETIIGKDGSKLKQEYAIAAAMKEMLRKGCRVQRTVNETTGKPQLIGRLA